MPSSLSSPNQKGMENLQKTPSAPVSSVQAHGAQSPGKRSRILVEVFRSLRIRNNSSTPVEPDVQPTKACRRRKSAWDLLVTSRSPKPVPPDEEAKASQTTIDSPLQKSISLQPKRRKSLGDLLGTITSKGISSYNTLTRRPQPRVHISPLDFEGLPESKNNGRAQSPTPVNVDLINSLNYETNLKEVCVDTKCFITSLMSEMMESYKLDQTEKLADSQKSDTCSLKSAISQAQTLEDAEDPALSNILGPGEDVEAGSSLNSNAESTTQHPFIEASKKVSTSESLNSTQESSGQKDLSSVPKEKGLSFIAMGQSSAIEFDWDRSIDAKGSSYASRSTSTTDVSEIQSIDLGFLSRSASRNEKYQHLNLQSDDTYMEEANCTYMGRRRSNDTACSTHTKLGTDRCSLPSTQGSDYTPTSAHILEDISPTKYIEIRSSGHNERSSNFSTDPKQSMPRSNTNNPPSLREFGAALSDVTRVFFPAVGSRPTYTAVYPSRIAAIADLRHKNNGQYSEYYLFKPEEKYYQVYPRDSILPTSEEVVREGFKIEYLPKLDRSREQSALKSSGSSSYIAQENNPAKIVGVDHKRTDSGHSSDYSSFSAARVGSDIHALTESEKCENLSMIYPEDVDGEQAKDIAASQILPCSSLAVTESYWSQSEDSDLDLEEGFSERSESDRLDSVNPLSCTRHDLQSTPAKKTPTWLDLAKNHTNYESLPSPPNSIPPSKKCHCDEDDLPPSLLDHIEGSSSRDKGRNLSDSNEFKSFTSISTVLSQDIFHRSSAPSPEIELITQKSSKEGDSSRQENHHSSAKSHVEVFDYDTDYSQNIPDNTKLDDSRRILRSFKTPNAQLDEICNDVANISLECSGKPQLMPITACDLNLRLVGKAAQKSHLALQQKRDTENMGHVFQACGLIASHSPGRTLPKFSLQQTNLCRNNTTGVVTLPGSLSSSHQLGSRSHSSLSQLSCPDTESDSEFGEGLHRVWCATGGEDDRAWIDHMLYG